MTTFARCSKTHARTATEEWVCRLGDGHDGPCEGGWQSKPETPRVLDAKERAAGERDEAVT